ncbi:MAG TPA: hypothetical protein VM864_07855 [Pyrinomonadaceae bacterium]|nr:hypothetical protein [Pyrinomonadaceae bacterium]
MRSLSSGLVGAVALTAIHETARRALPGEAPRMDVIGMRAIARSLRALDQEPPVPLHELTLAGDLAANTLYYSLVGVGARRNALLRGALLGAAAGVGAVLLPEPLGLGDQPSQSGSTKAMTVAWYVAGGLAAAAAFNLMGDAPGARHSFRKPPERGRRREGVAR